MKHSKMNELKINFADKDNMISKIQLAQKKVREKQTFRQTWSDENKR